MTRFNDGPAKGQNLMLKRAARFLRVVEENGKWDALDQREDTPKPTETIYAYTIVGEPGMSHIHASGGRGGFYTIANYRFVTPQPADSEMRDNNAWRTWCHNNQPQ